MTYITAERMPQRLVVVYDENCALCRRCRQWLEIQPTHLSIEFLAAGSDTARNRYGQVPWLGADLVVVDDAGGVWAGPAAFIVCLWATVRYRVWSYRLSGRAFAPLAESFFHLVSSNRGRIGAVVGARDCPDGRCKHRGAVTYQAPTTSCPACGAAIFAAADRCWCCGTGR
jgi:predicted DCC family thiol-disulfide oxidoreductase YuxK